MHKEGSVGWGNNTYRDHRRILLEQRWTKVNWNILGDPGGGMIDVELTLTLVPSILSKALR